MTKLSPNREEQWDAEIGIEPMLLSVLSSRLEGIIREMTNTVMKASRSAVIKNSRDFSCGLLTYDHRLLCVEDGIPIHIQALNLTTKPLTEFFDDIKEGDAFLNNCPYTGGTHHADLTVCVPVFCAGKPLFWTLARSHHADIGAPIPTTYLTEAATIYEEGMHFPCVRIQENRRDKEDLIRMCRMKIRVSEIWYGDYLAQIGACRVGEKRLQELVDRYGLETVEAFIEAWIRYGERRAIAEIRKLPRGVWSYETAHDPVPGVADTGIPVKVSVAVDPDEGLITVDARDNIDCVPGGLNLSEATAKGSCQIGVFFNLDPSIPHNEGSASRVKVLLRDGCVVGRPRYPAGTSVATTNVNSRLITAVACCFSQMGKPYGLGEFGFAQSISEAVISGTDPRKGDLEYVNQVFIANAGGPASCGTDGWLCNGAACDGAQITIDSVEIDESMYPVLIESRMVAKDSLGHGEWSGAPGIYGVYRPLAGEMTVIYGSDGDVNAAKGQLGGLDAAPSGNWKRTANGELEKLPGFEEVKCSPMEAVAFLTSGGAGYGDPKRRDPMRVVAAVNADWITKEIAEEVYAVALTLADNGVEYDLDRDETARRRSALGAGA
jgi:N-methylhydantoinase B